MKDIAWGSNCEQHETKQPETIRPFQAGYFLQKQQIKLEASF